MVVRNAIDVYLFRLVVVVREDALQVVIAVASPRNEREELAFYPVDVCGHKIILP